MDDGDGASRANGGERAVHGLKMVGTSDEAVGGWRRERLRPERTDSTVLIDTVFRVTEERDGDRGDAREEEDHHPAPPEAGWRWCGRRWGNTCRH